jgi:hypothetical protein
MTSEISETNVQPTQTTPETSLPEARRTRRPSVRTCVGCGAHDAPTEMVHVVVLHEVVVFDALFTRSHAAGLQGGEARGRGAHIHARPGCLAKGPAGLARSLRHPVASSVGELGSSLVTACNRRMEGLLVSARRLGSVAVGADAAFDAARRGAPLLIVAVDAGTVATKSEVTEAVASGRAIAWRTKEELGRLLLGGHHSTEGVAICALTGAASAGIAAELKRLRAAADAGEAATREEGARCRRPEGR